MPNKTQSNLVYQLIFFTGFILYLLFNSQRYIRQKPLDTSQDYPLSTHGTKPLVMTGGNPYIRALMRTITASEANVKQPYNVLYGGSLVDDLTSHPDRCIPILTRPNKGNCSTAAGRYQMLNYVWYEKVRLV